MIDGPINRLIFETWVETQLALTLSPGEVIVFDNLSAHKSPRDHQGKAHLDIAPAALFARPQPN